MNRRFALLLIVACIALTSGLFFANLARAGAPAARLSAPIAGQDGETPHTPQITSSLRISIPYGIAPNLPLLDQGRTVLVSGHGGCPAGETVTVAISITQPAYSAVATGELVEPCTGVEEQWSLLATVDTPASLSGGPAEACDTATMRLEGEVMKSSPGAGRSRPS